MSLLLPCLLTVLIETVFFALTGYKSCLFLALCVCVNAATNLTLNLLLPFLPCPAVSIYAAELLIVAAEYAAYGLAIGRGYKLFLLTLAANIVSYLAGVLIYGWV